jgi:hypothetical protein
VVLVGGRAMRWGWSSVAAGLTAVDRTVQSPGLTGCWATSPRLARQPPRRRRPRRAWNGPAGHRALDHRREAGQPLGRTSLNTFPVVPVGPVSSVVRT